MFTYKLNARGECCRQHKAENAKSFSLSGSNLFVLQCNSRVCVKTCMLLKARALSNDSLILCLLNIGDTFSSFSTTGLATDAVVIGFNATPSSRRLCINSAQGLCVETNDYFPVCYHEPCFCQYHHGWSNLLHSLGLYCKSWPWWET